jgi:hypothetical protein
MTRPQEVTYKRRKHREILRDKYYEDTIGRCTDSEHYWNNCKCSKWELKYFKKLLSETCLVNYLVDGPESVTPLYAEWCEIKLEMEK